MLFSRTSTKAIAVLVIALACVFGATSVANAGFVPPPLKNQATANPDATLNVIVLGQPTVTASALRDRVRNAGGRNIVPFSVIRGMVVNLTGSQLLSLASDPTVRSITPNGRVKGQSVTSGMIWPLATGINTLAGSLLSPAPTAPGIAFVDSGIDSSKWMDFGKRVQASLDFTGVSGPAGRDDNGHGTMVAGIAAGVSTLYPGASPTSNVYSLKVVRGDGSSYTGDVIAAADWIYKNAFSNNIRVANFSLRSSFPDFAAYDPLDAAVRRLWLTGTTVVASAGNSGNGRMLYAPATDPFVITVWRLLIADTVTRSDEHDGRRVSQANGYTAEGFREAGARRARPLDDRPVPSASTLAKTFPSTASPRRATCGCPARPSRAGRIGSRGSDPCAPPRLHARPGQGCADAHGEARAARGAPVARRRRGRCFGGGRGEPAEPEQEPLSARPQRRERQCELRLGVLERLRRDKRVLDERVLDGCELDGRLVD